MTAKRGMTAKTGVPRVSVLMTTRNGARFVAESIESVLAQTFRDFELVVVDDGSTDETPLVLARYDDPRLRVLRNGRSLGVVGARNHGFAALRGAYVATLDHDDLWRPGRLQAGVDLLDREPGTVLVATQNLVLRDGALRPTGRPARITPMLFRWMLHLDCPVAYSSLMFRRTPARRADGTFLRPDVPYADDYDLMLRLAALGGVACIDERLVIYRLHDGNTTRRVGAAMYESAVVVLRDAFRRGLGDEAEEAGRLVAWHVGRGQPVADAATLRRLGDILERLLGAVLADHRPDPEERARVLAHAAQVWWRIVRAGVRNGSPWLLPAYWRRPALAGHRAVPLLDAAGSCATGLLRLPRRMLS